MSRESDDAIVSFLLGMIIGAAAGGAVALLFAPRGGEETRREMKAFFKNLPERIEEEMEPDSGTRQFIDRTRLNIEQKVDRIQHNRQANKQAEAKRREEMASGMEYN